MDSEAYKDWTNLFNGEMEQIWYSESKELRNAAMLIVAVKKQFQIIQNSLDKDLDTFRKKIEDKDKENSQEYVGLEVLRPELDSESTLTDITNIPELTSSNKDERESLSPILMKNRKYIKSQRSVSPSFCFLTPAKKNYLKKLNRMGSTEDIFEASIIESTPEVLPKRIKNSKSGSLLSSKKIHEKNKSKTKLPSKTLPDQLSSSSNQSTDDAMGITSIINYINKSIKSKDETKIKEQEPTFVPQPVVRGHARKKLPGWSCDDCKKFYECQKLTEDELKEKMNQCSRHRSKFKPQEETIAGFWNLTMPTQSSQ